MKGTYVMVQFQVVTQIVWLYWPSSTQLSFLELIYSTWAKVYTVLGAKVEKSQPIDRRIFQANLIDSIAGES